MFKLLTLPLLALSFSACATPAYVAANETIYDTKNKTYLSLEQLTEQSDVGTIFAFGEEHAYAQVATEPENIIHHDNQLRLIQALKRRAPVDVGLEFLEYPGQAAVGAYVAGTMSEADFLVQAPWSLGVDFASYRPQILSTRNTLGSTYAMNIPQAVASSVAASGPGGLKQNQRALLPPMLRRGNAAYQARFKDAMAGHTMPPDKFDNFFWSQSLWDDTIAWKALQSPSTHFEVIIIGSFHVEFGGGMPSELKTMTTRKVMTLLQIEADTWTPEALKKLIEPDPKYGEHADYLWLHNGEVKKH